MVSDESYGDGPVMSGDPTRIDIEFDPLTQHMRGVSVHGHKPFDVPFMSEVASNLWQGGCQDGMILPSFIKHLVSLYPWESYRVNHALDTALQVVMYDSEDQAFDQVDTIAAWVNGCRATGPVLVHCQAGLNRSSLVAARALVLEGMPPADAIARIRATRSPACLCNPAFERWLLTTEPGAGQR
jgi:protein-tyrosine phosphatase